MNSMWKRSFALLLSLVLVFGMVPVNAFAEEAEHSHSYVDGVCTCGDVEHTHSYEAAVTAPTCTDAGYTTYTCGCGHSYTADEVAAAGHTYAEGVCACGAEEPAKEEPAVCDGTENCPAETHETTCECYDWCAALGCTEEAHHADCPWGPCTLTEGCGLAKGHVELGIPCDGIAAYDASNITTAAELINAVADGGEITLAADIQLDNTLTIESGKTVILNLNGFTVSQQKECTTGYAMIQNNGNLTITGNGKLSFTDTGAGDPSFGWGSYTIHNTGTLTVENGTIENLGQQASHCNQAIFQYSGSTTINGGTISTPNYRSFRLWHGSLNITGGEFIGRIWVQSATSTMTADVNISGGKFTPKEGDAYALYIDAGSPVTASITSGEFNGNIGVGNTDRLDNFITGGTFSSDVSDFVPFGYEFADGKVVESTNIKVTTVEELTQAIAIGEGKTITLMEDITVSETINVTKPVTLNLNGKTITNSVDSGRVFETYADMVIDGTVSGSSVKGDLGKSYGLVRLNNCSLTVNGGTYDFDTNNGAIFKINAGIGDLSLNNVTVDTNAMVIDQSSGIAYKNVTINGGSFTSVKTAMVISSTGTVTITNTTIESSDGAALEVGGATVTITGSTIGSEGKEGNFSGGIGDYTLAVSGNSTMTLAGNNNTICGMLGISPSGGTLNIEGGQFDGPVRAWASTGKTATINISGGTFTNAAPIVKKGDNGKEIIEISGGTFQADVTAYLALGYTQDSNGTVGEVKTVPAAPTVDTNNVTTNSTVGQSIADKLTANTANTTVDTKVDSAVSEEAIEEATGLLIQKAEEEAKKADPEATVTLTDVSTTVDIKVTAVDASETATTTAVTITYDITPVVAGTVVITDEAANQTTEIPITQKLENKDITEKIFFRLPVPSGVEGISEGTTVHVKHIHGDTTYFYVKQVQKDTNNNLFIEMSADKFSKFIVEFIDDNAPENVQVGEYTFEKLEQAYAYAKTSGATTIKLLGDVTLTETLKIEKTITLDLNGHTISAPHNASFNAIEIASGVTLTIKDSGTGGKISSISTKKLILVNGGALVLKSGTLECGYYGVNLYENASFTMDGGKIVSINDPKWGTYVHAGVLLDGDYGNNTKFIMNDGEIHAAVKSGLSNQKTHTIIINGGSITEPDTTSSPSGAVVSGAKYSRLEINGGTITGVNVGVRVSGGNVSINRGTITAKEKAVHVARFTGLADATYNPNISVAINGGTLQGTHVLYEETTYKTDKDGNITATLGSVDNTALSVTGGTIKGNVSSENCSHFISGGNFSEKMDQDLIVLGHKQEGGQIVQAEQLNYAVAAPKAKVSQNVSLADADKTSVVSSSVNGDSKVIDSIDSAVKSENINTLVQGMNKVGATDIVRTMNITLTKVTADANNGAIKKLTFNIHPEIQALRKKSATDTNPTVISSAKVPNDTLNGEITFRIPLPNSVNATVAYLTHGTTSLGLQPIQTANGQKFIEYTSNSFSEWIVEPVVGVTSTDGVAAIGEATFATLEDAVARASSGDTIKLLQNITTEAIGFNTSVTLDLNGKTLDCFALVVDETGNLTIKDTAADGTLVGGVIVQEKGTFSLESGTLKSSTGNQVAQEVVLVNGGTANIKGGTVTHSGEESIGIQIDSGILSVTGSTISGDTGIVVNGGNVNLSGGNVSGTNAVAVNGGYVTVFDGNFTGTKTGMIVHNNGVISIQNGTFRSDNGIPVNVNAGISGIAVGGTYIGKELDPDVPAADYEYVLKQGSTYVIQEKGYIVVNDKAEYYAPDTESIKIDGAASVGSLKHNTVVTVANGVVITIGADGSKTFAPTYLDGKGWAHAIVTFPDANGKIHTIHYFLDKGATLTVAANGTITTSGKVIVGGNGKGNPGYNYTITQNNVHGNVHVRNSSPDMVITCNGFLGACKRVYITGGKYGAATLDVYNNGSAQNGFSVVDGSTKVTLTSGYLNGLTDGTYTMVFQYKDGEQKAASFKVTTLYTAQADTTNPKTGDEIFVPMFVLFFSTAALAVLLMGKKKFF